MRLAETSELVYMAATETAAMTGLTLAVLCAGDVSFQGESISQRHALLQARLVAS
ncbi:hypothetical protein [Gluconobacter wancherniae]|uniref:hypothetical protein n=1 Tax=Gluconobacter wancherniae TaxID=1307955 RepID=UPI0020111866|nr:hypothetical protein [Gluconobacter wancherniae]